MISVKDLHIISFNIPYPPSYGGLIDIYYKIRQLYEAGYLIHLHAFEYNRKPSPDLEKYCTTFNYYKRRKGIFSFLSSKPYIVYSRKNPLLLANLLKNDYPILFEGLHSCYYLNDIALRNRIKLVRMHNIEHKYYKELYLVSKNIFEKFYFLTESIKLKFFEKNLKAASELLAINQNETLYFREKYGKTTWVSAFHANSIVNSIPGKGKFILLHGNLSVIENENAIIHALKKILNSVNFHIIIAGHSPSRKLIHEAGKNSNVRLIVSPDDNEMNRLIKEAHIHLLISFQNTGMKLKLLNALFSGRFVIANPDIVLGTGLERMVLTGNTNSELTGIIIQTIPLEFTTIMIEERKQSLSPFSAKESSAKLDKIIQSHLTHNRFQGLKLTETN